jgi:hypothetical protein
MATEERETVSLIGSDKVEGTSVYGADETQIGSIERVMIDKRSGKVSYAVLSFGGFLGIGDDHYPIPWESLKYDTNLGGYRTGITEQQLQGAPKYGNDNEWSWEDQTRTRAGACILTAKGPPQRRAFSYRSNRKRPQQKAAGNQPTAEPKATTVRFAAAAVIPVPRTKQS